MKKKRKPVRAARRAKARKGRRAVEPERTGGAPFEEKDYRISFRVPPIDIAGLEQVSIVEAIDKRMEDARRATLVALDAGIVCDDGRTIDTAEMNFSNGDYPTYGNSHRWVPDVAKTMLLVKGRNELTGRQCRVYVRPGRRVTVVEDLN